MTKPRTRLAKPESRFVFIKMDRFRKGLLIFRKVCYRIKKGLLIHMRSCYRNRKSRGMLSKDLLLPARLGSSWAEIHVFSGCDFHLGQSTQ